MVNNETTNVDHHKIRACLATIEAGMKEFNPMQSTELAIRAYLKENPTVKIKVKEFEPKERAALKAAAKKAMSTSERIRE